MTHLIKNMVSFTIKCMIRTLTEEIVHVAHETRILRTCVDVHSNYTRAGES